MNFAENYKIEQAITPTAGAAGTSDINGATCDLQNADGMIAIVAMGAITATAVTSIKLQESDDDSTWADLEGTGVTVADDDDEQIFYLELDRPQSRYARVVVDRGTANAVVSAAEYITWGRRKVPVTHGATVSGEINISPDAGTA